MFADEPAATAPAARIADSIANSIPLPLNGSAAKAASPTAVKRSPTTGTAKRQPAGDLMHGLATAPLKVTETSRVRWSSSRHQSASGSFRLAYSATGVVKP